MRITSLELALGLPLLFLLTVSCKSLADDVPTGPDGSAPCGEVDELCCNTEPVCGESMICVNGVDQMAPEDMYCLLECIPPVCENVEGYEGTCSDVGLPGNGGACLVDEDFTPTGCQEGHDDCETPSGASENTICLSSGGETYCFEICQVVEEICDDAHTCVATSNGSGGCLPE